MMSMVLDAVLAVLLVVTIAYAWRLNRRLRGLRESRVELETLIASFSEVTARAEKGVTALKTAGTDGVERLRRSLDAAGRLGTDLSFLIERGEAVADRLESAQRSAPAPRGRRPTATAAPPAPAPEPETVAAPLAGLESEILKALRGAR